jgi:hypothetical protein
MDPVSRYGPRSTGYFASNQQAYQVLISIFYSTTCCGCYSVPLLISFQLTFCCTYFHNAFLGILILSNHQQWDAHCHLLNLTSEICFHSYGDEDTSRSSHKSKRSRHWLVLRWSHSTTTSRTLQVPISHSLLFNEHPVFPIVARWTPIWKDIKLTELRDIVKQYKKYK